MNVPRKVEMSELEHAVCNQVKALRLSLGLSQRQFARQMGCTSRTLIRWEKHIHAPLKEHLLRLRQLKQMADSLDRRDRKRPLVFEDDGRKCRSRKMKRGQVSKIAPRLLAALVRRIGGRISLPQGEVAGPGQPVVEAKLDPARGEYAVWVRKGSKAR